MSLPLRVLLVEDSEDDALLLMRELRRGGYLPNCERVDTLDAFSKALAEQDWDLIIADYLLPQFSGLAALKYLKSCNLDIPFLIISGIIDEHMAVEAMKSGAHDYLMKDNLKRLVPTVERELREAGERRSRRAFETALADRQSWLRRANEVLLQLARSPSIQEGDLTRAFAEITEATVQLLSVARASIWLFTEDRTQFCCYDLYILASQEHTQEAPLNTDEYPEYIRALAENRYIAAHDVYTDPRTAELSAIYLIPQGITSILDVAIMLQGQLVGVICLEHVGPIRHWQTEEEVLAGSLADLVALALGANERQQTAEALRKREEKYRDLFENANDMIYTLDLEGRFTSVNKRAEQVLGYTRAELVGTVVDHYIAPEYVVLSFVNWDRKFAHQTDATIYELEVVRRDGQHVPLEVNTRLIYEAGEAVGVQGIARDISERKQAESALRMSEEKYRDLFEYANDVIYIHDLQGNFLSVNQKAEQITGYKRDEVIKLNMSQIIVPEYLELAKTNILKKLQGESSNTVYELEVICKDGSKRPLEVNTRLLYEGQRPVGVQGIARDISERKQLEEQLRQSQKMEAVGRLAGAVAHDFNNLLTAILGYSQLLLRRLDPNGPMRKEVVEIEKAGQRAAALTNQLLAFSRKQVFQPQVLNLNLVVADIEKMLQRLIGEDIELRAIFDPMLGLTKADRGRLEQVIMNLAVNSRDAMPRGGQLTIYTANVELDELPIEAAPGAYIMLAVADTGMGMDKETLLHIFEPFFTTKEPGKGTGLGLSTVYGIVKQSGGYITCQSEPRQGTLFRIYLPRIEEPAERLEGQPSVAEVLFGNETILLVEDDDAVRELTQQMLAMNGYAVLEASNAQDALSICRERTLPIPLLITDVVMPLTNGPELAQQVLQLRPETKVLYISGYTDNLLALRSSVAGSLPLLQKPFTPEGLTRKVREILDSA